MTAAFTLAALLLVTSACAQPPATPAPTPATAHENQTMSIAEAIKNKDWRAVQTAQASGPAVVPQVEPFTKDQDMVIRALATDCLAAAGGPRAQELMIKALLDPSEQVRIAAVNGLHARPPQGQEAALFEAWDKASDQRDGYVRQQVPMIAGRLGKPASIDEIRTRRREETRGFVQDGLLSGMAKLADPDARKEVGRTIRASFGKRIAEFMPFVTYLDDQWTLPYLLPLMDHQEEALELSTHIVSFKRRGVDLAVDEVLRLKPGMFQIPRDTTSNYTPAQIAEVKKFLASLPPAQY